MDIERLSRFGSAVRDRTILIWESDAVRRGRHWLTERWQETPSWKIWTVFGLLALTGFLIGGGASWTLAEYQASRNDLNPIIVGISGLAAGLFALIPHF